MTVSGCAKAFDKTDIVKIVDFELSPDEEKIAFAAVTPVGNTDIWVVDINGTNLKKLTFKDRSPTNHLAGFFKKRKWRGFYEVDMCSPAWTKDGDVLFCQKLTKYDMHGARTVNKRYWTIKTDGSDKKSKTAEDKIVIKRPFGPVNRYKTSEQSDKHKKKILLKDDTLWVLSFGESTSKKLMQ